MNGPILAVSLSCQRHVRISDAASASYWLLDATGARSLATQLRDGVSQDHDPCRGAVVTADGRILPFAWPHRQALSAITDLEHMASVAESTMVESIEDVIAERDRLRTLLNTPEVEDFLRGTWLEAGHQVERWGTAHDRGKAPEDWFWLVGYLAGKALHAAKAGDRVKAKHHTISTAATLCNWHRAISGGDTHMTPGLSDVEAAIARAFGREVVSGGEG